jgi:hypothetical protein
MHSTNNLEDGYLGSGKRLRYSIGKYGGDKHICEKLEFLSSRKKLTEREIEIVDEKFLEDPLCMNLMVGGTGGKISDEQQLRRAKAANKARSEKLKNDPEFYDSVLLSSAKALKKRRENGEIFRGSAFEGKTHSKETKKRIGLSNSIKQKGELNSQAGTCWITNEKESKKIHRGDDIPKGYRLGRTLR